MPEITISKPRRRKDALNHQGCSFRELVDAWEQEGYVKVVPTDSPYCWLGNDILLHDFGNLAGAYDIATPDYRIGLFANEIPDDPKYPLWKISPWIFWGKHVIKDPQRVPYHDRQYTCSYVGTISTPIQAKYRTTDWSKHLGKWSLKDIRKGEKPEYSYDEYIDIIRHSKYGLSLRGFGPKCLREIELMAYGVVPILTPGVCTKYYNPLVEGTHYLVAHTPDDVKTIIDNTPEDQWERMSQACIQWWKDNCSIEGSFRTTMKIVEDMRAKVDGIQDRTEEILPYLIPQKCRYRGVPYTKVRTSNGHVIPREMISSIGTRTIRIGPLNDVPSHSSNLSALRQMDKDHILFHVHSDNSKGAHKSIPNVMDLTYISKEYVDTHSRDMSLYPTTYDMPVTMTTQDMELTYLHKVPMTHDWFSMRSGIWWQLLREYIGKETHYLEIGTFEGRSLSWVCRQILKHPSSRAYAIDTWEGSDEHSSHDKDGLYDRYLASTTDIRNKVVTLRGYSGDVLKRQDVMARQYDIIYIDGDHHAYAAMEDACLAFPLLKSGGILIFDDYMYGKIDTIDSPHMAINAFITCYRSKLDIIGKDYQMYLRKK